MQGFPTLDVLETRSGQHISFLDNVAETSVRGKRDRVGKGGGVVPISNPGAITRPKCHTEP